MLWFRSWPWFCGSFCSRWRVDTVVTAHHCVWLWYKGEVQRAWVVFLLYWVLVCCIVWKFHSCKRKLSLTQRVPWTYLFRKANDQAILRLAHQRLEEILAAGGQHGPVPAELLALHQDSHIAQDILLPLVVEAEEDIGTMNRRLIHIHGGFRLLIYGHSAHALEIEAQQRGVSLQPNSASAYRRADISHPHDSTHTSPTDCCSLCAHTLPFKHLKASRMFSGMPLLSVDPCTTSTHESQKTGFET